MTYGTGAIMAVPRTTSATSQFALKFGLPIIPVIERTDGLAKSAVVGGSVTAGLRRTRWRQAGIDLRVADIAGRGAFYA